MVLDNPALKLNEPIFLENTNITHIENHRLPSPCSVHVVLYLWPTITCRAESNNLPTWLLNDYQYKPFFVTLENGCKIKSLLSYNLNDLLFNRNSRDTFKGFLVPYINPCTVAQSDTRIKSVSFSVLNFEQFYGSYDKKIEVAGEYVRKLGATEMKDDDWQIDIAETLNSSENRRILRRYGGYFITHTGLIKRSKGKPFTVNEAENVLNGLRALLSFSSGSACGLTLVKATDLNDRELILKWGATYTKPWNHGVKAWLPITDGGDSLSLLFPGFWRLYDDLNWNDTIRMVIDWYLNSNNNASHVGIVLSQAALESLFYKIIGSRLSAREIKKLRAAEKLRGLLKRIGIDKEIPSSCKDLKHFSNQEIKQKRNKSNYLGDGPEAIVEIRNDLVHPKKEYDHIPAEAHMDASKLSRWYTELILLKEFGYCGRYMNRLRSADKNSYEYVPWANGSLEIETT